MAFRGIFDLFKDSDQAYIDPRDRERVKRDKLRCDVCGNLLRRPYRIRCYKRRSSQDLPEHKVDRKLEAPSSKAFL